MTNYAASISLACVWPIGFLNVFIDKVNVGKVDTTRDEDSMEALMVIVGPHMLFRCRPCQNYHRKESVWALMKFVLSLIVSNNSLIMIYKMKNSM